MYGQFIKDTAGYEIHTLNLPASWEYIYENRDILLKMDQFGPVYAQAHPPGDIVLFKREQHQKFSPWLIHLCSDSFPQKITNFFRPNRISATAEPDDVCIRFLPESASYSFAYGPVRMVTEFIIPQKGTTVAMRFTVQNTSQKQVELDVIPQLVPYLNEASMALWDKYEWYLDTSCEKNEKLTFTTKLLNADAKGEKRRQATFLLPVEDLTDWEVSLEKFVGQGDLSGPECILSGGTRNYGYPPVYGAGYHWSLAPGQEKTLSAVLTIDEPQQQACYFERACFEEKKAERKQKFDTLFSKNRVTTGDSTFDAYVNHWLPLQMNWVASLDRGWPTGMRGSRDSAQDYAALLYSNTKAPKQILLTMLECQRTDGWFPRQYSANGRHGKHDLRTHVDGGAFFVEFLYKYLAHTRDFDILNKVIPWLDSDRESTVLEHLITAVEYYICPENIGEHGLCKIRGGDWLDAVNTAGLEDRGESVTVSEQTVMSLKYLADILRMLDKNADVSRYLDFAETLKKCINQHAFNEQGFYNGVFNDDGKWIFSDCDPDGECRMYGVSNYYAIISGVAEREKHAAIVKKAQSLKCDKGYRLFYPHLGDKPMEKVGRIASGDVPRYLGENGNVYNHGSQGFFARALAEAGEGDLLFDTLKWIMPYDTEKHPTELAFTPPYAIVNCWQELPAFNHRGLMCFLTGSVAMAMRGVYEWMFGIRPVLDGLEIAPCLPEHMQKAQVQFEYLGKAHVLRIDGGKVYLDENLLTEKRKTLITGKEAFFVKF
ncbi:MAG: hypothetical protein IJO28_01830 [Oscillospiraceae bacterium]|nr:hypothetical protein [Oscillospiraceae bacterium]